MLDNDLPEKGMINLDLSALANTKTTSCNFYELKTSLRPVQYAEIDLIKGTYSSDKCIVDSGLK
jgi:hypothetical protein